MRSATLRASVSFAWIPGDQSKIKEARTGETMLRTLFKNLGLVKEWKPPVIDQRAWTADLLRRLVGTCDACGKPLSSQHTFAKLAEMVVGSEKPGIVELGEGIAARNWNNVTSFGQWEATRDNLLVYAIACPDGGGMVVRIYDPVELYDSISLYRKELLRPEEMQDLVRFAPKDKWQSM